MLAMTSIGDAFKRNMQTQPHFYVTLLLVGIGIALILLAALPGKWWLKIGVAAWVVLP